VGHPNSRPDSVSSIVLELCHLDELEDGAARGFDPFDEGRDAMFVVRRGNEVKGYRNACPHQGASLPWRKHEYLNADGTRIVCSAHGAQFDIDSGRCLIGPALGQSLDEVSVTVNHAGRVLLTMPRTNKQ
jgi:nitrite reductase/ring-hydroxylating ferredoxin subunit